MPPALILAALVGEQTNQLLASVAAQLQLDLDGPVAKVVNDEHVVVAPAVAKREHALIAGVDHAVVTPAKLGDLFAHADDALGPVQERLRVLALHRGIDA